MSARLCPKCGYPLRLNAQTCSHCDWEDKAASRKPDLREISATSKEIIRCPKCHTPNDPQADYCSQCQSPLRVRARLPRSSSNGANVASSIPIASAPSNAGTSRNIAKPLLLIALAIMLIGVVAIVLSMSNNPPDSPKLGIAPTFTPIAPISSGSSIAPSPSASPVSLPSSTTMTSVGNRVITDKQFGYEITIPTTWQVALLNGARQGPSEYPVWSAIISNMQIDSLQSLPPGTTFAISIYRAPVSTEDEVLEEIAGLVMAQPGDILRGESNPTKIEYFTAKVLLNQWGRPMLGKWLWDGKQLLSFIVLIYDRDQVSSETFDQVLDSCHSISP